MKFYDYENQNDLYSIRRSPDRNLPEACQYCIYQSLPSRAGMHCSGPCYKFSPKKFNNDKPVKKGAYCYEKS